MLLAGVAAVILRRREARRALFRGNKSVRRRSNLRILFSEWAAASDALVVLRGVVAGDGRFFQRDAEMFLYEIAGGEDGQEGIPLAAARAADRADPAQGLRGHLVGQRKGLYGQRGRMGDDGDRHPRADTGSAGAPKAAGTSGDAFPPAHHFGQGARQIDVAAGIPVRRQQSRSDHDMMLRAMHMTEGHSHHLFNNRYRVSGGLCQAQSDNAVQSPGMTVITYIVAIHTSRFAVFLFVADGALHRDIRRQIFQGRLADQAFFIHQSVLLIIPRW